MKNIITTTALLAIALSIFVQNTVQFEIIHKLHGEDFAFNKETFNDQGFTFNADRLQYYISEISVKHDGGNVTEFDDVWILVNAGQATNVQLGSDTIDSIESISFHIGVDPAHNHLDHTQYSSSHPLGPKNPQMHWGWTAGYRFVAMEGDIGPDLDNNYQFHALGDDNYFETTVASNAKAENGSVTVQVYANYAHALNGLSNIEDGFVLHSEIGECVTVLENFRDYVFSMEPPADTVQPVIQDTTDTTDVTGIHKPVNQRFTIAPNPTSDFVFVSLNQDIDGGKIEVYDNTGVLVVSERFIRSGQKMDISTLPVGVYHARYIGASGGVMHSSPIVKLE